MSDTEDDALLYQGHRGRFLSPSRERQNAAMRPAS